MSLSARKMEVRTVARLGMFVGILVYLASTTSYLLKFILEDTPLAVPMASYARPLVTVLFALGAFLLADQVKDSLIRMRWLLIIFLLSSITFPALDFIHAADNIAPIQLAKEFLYNKTFSTYLTAFFLLLATGILITRENVTQLLRAGIWTLAFSSFLSIVIWVIIRVGLITTDDILWTNNNFQAYESVGLLFMLMLFPKQRPSAPWLAAILTMSAVLPVLHSSRGAMLLAGYVCLIWTIRGWRGRECVAARERRLVLGALGISMVIIAFGVSGMWTTLLSENVAAPRVAPSSSSAVPESERVGVTERLADIYRLPTPPAQINLLSNNEVSTSDDVVSAFSRLGTTLLAVKTFMSAPWLGIGIWDAYKLEVANSGIHGLVPLLMAAYGVWGFLPLLAFVIAAWMVAVRAGCGTLLLHFVIIMFGLGMLLNIFAWWLGLVFAFCFFYESELKIS